MYSIRFLVDLEGVDSSELPVMGVHFASTYFCNRKRLKVLNALHRGKKEEKKRWVLLNSPFLFLQWYFLLIVVIFVGYMIKNYF